MIKVDYTNLNVLERKLLDSTKECIQHNSTVTITELSTQLDVSTSKISKFVRKMGFESFKQYKRFLISGQAESPQIKPSDELQRISEYIANFDDNLAHDFWLKIKDCNKLIIYGLGPSFICADYFAYRLRIFSDVFTLATNEITTVRNADNKDTKLLVLSTTGLFQPFDDEISGLNYKEIIFLFEEFRYFPKLQKNMLFYLTNSCGNSTLKPYEKSRTLFFIFLEEIIQKFIPKPL
ncbi:putative DNA-binding transcriptional regulator [Yersinia aldovae]|uniref:MurR/RpiR family transcriptional regulator n=1 Tax=Yersinia aldovae TaxID=29483 RepID=UPI0005DAF0EE|nr:MurR/RpiR family transcriptional regulator [Yersinia aldovae]CNH95759.1 putative DNA-binding transcriptional regulator [Yersinia aldovae]